MDNKDFTKEQNETYQTGFTDGETKAIRALKNVDIMQSDFTPKSLNGIIADDILDIIIEYTKSGKLIWKKETAADYYTYFPFFKIRIKLIYLQLNIFEDYGININLAKMEKLYKLVRKSVDNDISKAPKTFLPIDFVVQGKKGIIYYNGYKIVDEKWKFSIFGFFVCFFWLFAFILEIILVIFAVFFIIP